VSRVKEGDILWRMVGRYKGEEVIWQAESKVVTRIDKRLNDAFFFEDRTGASQNSLGKSYFRSKQEAEADHTEFQKKNVYREVKRSKCKGCKHLAIIGTKTMSNGEHENTYGCAVRQAENCIRGMC